MPPRSSNLPLIDWHLAPADSTSGLSIAAGSPKTFPSGVILSQACTPLQSITEQPPLAPTSLPSLPKGKKRNAAVANHLPRFVSLQRFPSYLEPFCSDPFPTGSAIRPQGFSPPRRFAPLMLCQACSILVPLMGFALRGFAPPDSVADPFEPRGPRGVGLACQSRLASPSGLVSPSRIPPRDPAFTEDLLRIPPWVCASPRYVARCNVSTEVAPFPLALCRRAHECSRRWHPRDFFTTGSVCLSRDPPTSSRFLTSSAFSTLRGLRCAGLSFPRRSLACRHARPLPFRTPPAPCRSSSRKPFR